PSYPTGAFSYSHGLEYAVEAALVTDAASLARWVRTVIERGTGWIDCLLAAESWRASTAQDLARLTEVALLAAAWRGTAELAWESEAQGRAFLAAPRDAWPHRLLDDLAGSTAAVALPVAVGAAAGAAALPLDLVLNAYLQSIAGNLVSAGMRLIPLGQSA